VELKRYILGEIFLVQVIVVQRGQLAAWTKNIDRDFFVNTLASMNLSGTAGIVATTRKGQYHFVAVSPVIRPRFWVKNCGQGYLSLCQTIA